MSVSLIHCPGRVTQRHGIDNRHWLCVRELLFCLRAGASFIRQGLCCVDRLIVQYHSLHEKSVNRFTPSAERPSSCKTEEKEAMKATSFNLQQDEQ